MKDKMCLLAGKRRKHEGYRHWTLDTVVVMFAIGLFE